MAGTTTDLLSELKNSLHIPLNVSDDDSLLNDYIYSAKAYLNNACNNDMSLDDRYKFIVIELASLFYQNRGTAIVTKDFPYSLRCVINQLKCSY
ncbi:DNA-packaging protein [Lentilactobacillus parakefiri]|uniref:head-tail connector protein n=1 Tax=Lentilactobacillus parakefiri TaxID=152332 RepID=UPI000BA6C815|nr:head-tail connector protein [Lentilactobacillus parakefiri]PAK99542.1 DNA-packaging protein [Lentilactobacillus parakefiri]